MTLPSGTRLGGYEILSPLGAGGMGEVYRARDSKLGREVAVKLLPERLAADPDALARFAREAKLLAALNHPNIASIFGLEESGGTPLIVMELIPGMSLDERLSPGALSIAESLAFASQIAAALEYAHSAGIIHRDLKPSNIRVMPSGFVKILDFGLAKVFAEETPAADMSKSPTLGVNGRTKEGVIVGTAPYMSPEQTRGLPLNRQSDIWSFGCVLYEMLTGHPAFGGPSVSDILVAILTREPEWGALPEKTPPRIRELLRHCLRKEVTGRLHDMGDASIEIKEAAAALSQPLTLHSAPASRAARPRRLLAAGIAIAGLLLAALAGLRLLSGSRVPARKYVAVLPFKDLSGLPGGQLVGDGLVETVSARLSRLPTVQVVTSAATVAESDRQPDPYKAARELGANLILRGSVQRNGDRVRITYSVLSTEARRQIAGDTLDGSASELFTMQDRLADEVTASLALPRALRSPVPTGLATASEQDRYLRAIGLLQRYDRPASVDEAIGLLVDLGAEVPASPLIPAALGRAYLYKFSDTRESKWVDRASEACGRAQKLNPNFAEVDVTLGELRRQTGQFGEAISSFERALASQPNNFEAALGLASASAAAGKLAEAETTYQRAIALRPTYWAGYNKLGGFFFSHGEYGKAADLFKRVVQLAPDSALGYYNLGAACQQLGKFQEAERAYRRSIEIKPASNAYSNLGTLYFELGRYFDAATAYEKATVLTPASPVLWANLGDAYRFAPGLRAKSDAAYARAIRLIEDGLRVNARDPSLHMTLALCLARSGKPEEAAAEARQALELDPKDTNNMYQAAVVAAASGLRAEAVKWIRRAVENGYRANLVEREPEFAALRNEASYREALNAGKTPGSRQE